MTLQEFNFITRRIVFLEIRLIVSHIGWNVLRLGIIYIIILIISDITLQIVKTVCQFYNFVINYYFWFYWFLASKMSLILFLLCSFSYCIVFASIEKFNNWCLYNRIFILNYKRVVSKQEHIEIYFLLYLKAMFTISFHVLIIDVNVKEIGDVLYLSNTLINRHLLTHPTIYFYSMYIYFHTYLIVYTTLLYCSIIRLL